MSDPSHIARAIPLYILAGLFLSSLDATAKILVRDYPVWWVVWARYAGHVLVVLPLAWSRAGSGFWRTGQPLLQLTQGDVARAHDVALGELLGLAHVHHLRLLAVHEHHRAVGADARAAAAVDGRPHEHGARGERDQDLSDGQGRTVDFRNVILVMTSNIGSHFLVDPTMPDDSKREAVMGMVRASFKPEFLNRLDEVVVFDPLSTEELARIVELQVRALSARLADRRVTLEVTEAAKEWLALTGYDQAYGARPLRRLVQREIGDRLARALLAGEVRDGSTVTVDRDEAADSLVLR